VLGINRPKPRDGRTSFLLATISIILLVLGLIFIGLYSLATQGNHLRYASVGLLTACASLLSGCLIGFLFGIPKVVSSGEFRIKNEPPITGGTPVVVTTGTGTAGTGTAGTGTAGTGTAAAEMAGAEMAGAGTPSPGTPNPGTPNPGTPNPGTPNPGTPSAATLAGSGRVSPFEPSTNLSEVSDWLTKLLLGAGLVELTHMGKPLGKLIQTIGTGLSNAQPPGDSATHVMAGALLVTYSVLGFLDGYVVTTLWYGSRVRRVG
jgi:hypothetical protein